MAATDSKSREAAQIGCTSVAYLRHPLERALSGIAGCGIRNVELASIPRYCGHLPPGQIPDAATLSRLCAEYGLHPVAISAHGDLKDEADRAHVADCMQLAADVGVGIVNTGTGDLNDDGDGDRIKRAIEQLARIGERLGVTLGVETQNTVFTSGAQAVDMIERIGSDRVRVNLDAANIRYWSGNEPLAEVRIMAKYVANMHVKDHRGGRGNYDFPPLGSGDIPLSAIVDCLLEVGFEGMFVLEPEASQPVEERPADEVARVRERPGLAYSEFHSYLGERDPGLIDAEVCAARQYLEGILATHALA